MSLERSSLTLVSARTPKQAGKKRKYNRMRLLERSLFAAAAFGMVVFASVATIDSVREITKANTQGTATITVAAGDSLWKIAGSLSGPNLQQSDALNELRTLNPQLGSNEGVYAGEKLRIPVCGEAAESDLHLAKSTESASHTM